MRLQVAIYRNTLPPVNIIYNTSSASVPIQTVSDLLNALNAVVPLESSDGEWGLEEYTVEVAATADQQQAYECLHFQFVKDVLREDDEVVIRGLTSEELRERRQGGRSQITSDGRHLLDGVSWGRRWRAQAQRPGVLIPPRKRRRLLSAEDDTDDSEVDPQQLEYLPAGSQIGTVIEEDDEDFEPDEEDEDSDIQSADSTSTDTENDLENGTDNSGKHMQIYARQEFDDADQDEDTEGSLDSNEDLEVEALLDQIEHELEEGVSNLHGLNTRSSKRKRDVEDDGAQESDEDVFKGFTSSSGITEDRLESTEDGAAIGNIGPYPVQSQLSSELVVSDQIIDDDSVSNDSTSSGASLSSDSGDSEDSSDTDSESESQLSSDSDDDTGSSSSEDSVSDIKDSKLTNGQLSGNITQKTTFPGTAPSSNTAKGNKDNPPGSGTKRTKQNNDRAKRKKRLQALKKQGLLPEDAGYEALRNYEKSQYSEQEADESTNQTDAMPDNALDLDAERLHKQKEELLARINADSSGSDVGEPEAVADVTNHAAEQANVQQPKLPQESITNDTKVSVTEVAVSEPPKRTRLDVESSRRMLFGSLGLRTPKTKAAEEALRTKLSQPVRTLKTKPPPVQDEANNDQLMDDEEDNSWRTKLQIFAVECVREGVVMTPPPFPFKQRWELGTGSARMQVHEYRSSRGYDDTAVPSMPAAIDRETTETSIAQGAQDMSLEGTESKTVSVPTAELDHMSNIDEFAKLPELNERSVINGAIIAYRQLHINARFEPEESAYRVAQVSKVDDGLIGLVLASKFREFSSARYDEETGERVIHGLEMPEEIDDEEDDGYREVRFEEMIQPKLVKPSSVQVPASADDVVPHVSHGQDHEGFQAVPESAPHEQATQTRINMEQVEVNTPRRNEITTLITEAGFDSALDDQLLMPIALPVAREDFGKPVSDSTADSAHLTEGKLQAVRTTSLPKEWSSSILEEGESRLFDTSHTNNVATSSMSNGTSPPTISLVETVDYPHVSQMDINGSSSIEHVASSSHQDAQRPSPDALHVEYSNTSQSRPRQSENGESQASEFSATSLPSEVPQSQLDPVSQAVTEQELYLGLRGGDGAVSSSEQEAEATDSDGLPSLRALTASQKYRPVSQLSQLSPPPDLDTSQTGGKPRSDRLSPPSDFDENSNIEHESMIKVSQSQQLRLSQIPQDVSIIDLTTSDPVQPSEGSDKEYVETVRSGKRNRATKRDVNGSHAGAKMMKSALASLGSRRSLTGKKRSNI